MSNQNPYTLSISFPGELEYIPLVRKLISDMLLVKNFSPKFAFRSELIADELCNNAVNYGANIARTSIEFTCTILNDEVSFTIKDPGGSGENVKRLQDAISSQRSGGVHPTHGLELVRILAEDISCSIDDRNIAAIHVVRKRETVGAGTP